MHNYLFLIAFIFIFSCNTPKVDSAQCVLQLELPNRMFLHTGEFQYPTKFHTKQSSFFSADSIIKDKESEISFLKRNKILKLSSGLLKDSIPLHYGFEKNERTGLLYTLTIKLNNKEKIICIYDYSDTMKLPEKLQSLLKEMLELM